MKVIKNKRRFDPRWHHSERLESKEQDLSEIDEIKVNFNSFNLDTWLEEDAAKEKEYPPTQPKREKKDEEKLDAEMAALRGKHGEEIRRGEHPLVEDPNEGCGGPEMGPEEPEAAVSDLSSDDTFDAGYTAAVEEIMASIQGLLEDPVDMAPPEEMAIDDDEMVVQLPDDVMETNEDEEEQAISSGSGERIYPHRQLKRAAKMTKGKTPGRTDYGPRTPRLTNPVKAGRLAVSESPRVQEGSGDSYMVKLNLTKEQWEALELETRKKVARLMGTTRSTSGDGSIERAVGFVETWQDMGFTDEHIQVFENGNEILISDIVEDPTGNIDQAEMYKQTL